MRCERETACSGAAVRSGLLGGRNGAGVEDLANSPLEGLLTALPLSA
jgi:hypothetical protein